MKTTLIAMTLTVLVGGLSVQATSHAQVWPQKPVTLVVPFPAGGSTDTVARAIGPKMAIRLNQAFVIDNRAGATGTIGTAFVKRAQPDGYTLLVTSLGPLTIVPHLVKQLPYDARTDFEHVTVAVQAPNLLVVPAASGIKSLQEMLAELKNKPGALAFGSAGNGSSPHLTAELFWKVTGTKGLHVPYKGGALAMNDLLAGTLAASFPNINEVIKLVQAGRLRALAITSKTRSPLLPDVPTLSELGIQGADVYSWQAVVAPKGLPSDIKRTMHAAIVAALNEPDVKARFVEQGFEIVASTPAEFQRYHFEEFARWQRLIESSKITID